MELITNTIRDGVAMIDCKNLELTSEEEQSVEGLYAYLEAAYKNNKQVILCNCLYDDSRSTPIAVMMIKDNDIYICTSNILQLSVDSNDDITITNLLEE